MEKINWCLKVKNGIELVEENPNLSQAYFKKSEEALQALALVSKNKDWAISTSYYSMYFAVYAILMRIGIKCEIHACTLEFIKSFLSVQFTKEDIDFFEQSMKARNDSQYYVDRTVPDAQYIAMIKKAPSFLVMCKELLFKLSEKEIKSIREKVKSLGGL